LCHFIQDSDVKDVLGLLQLCAPFYHSGELTGDCLSYPRPCARVPQGKIKNAILNYIFQIQKCFAFFHFIFRMPYPQCNLYHSPFPHWRHVLNGPEGRLPLSFKALGQSVFLIRKIQLSISSSPSKICIWKYFCHFSYLHFPFFFLMWDIDKRQTNSCRCLVRKIVLIHVPLPHGQFQEFPSLEGRSSLFEKINKWLFRKTSCQREMEALETKKSFS